MTSQDQLEGGSRFWTSRIASTLVARPRLVRWILAGPVALMATLITMMGMAIWWPEGTARIDNIAMPVILFPLIWAGFFLYAIIAENLVMAIGLTGAVITVNLLLLVIG